MIRAKTIFVIPSSKAARSIKNDPGDAISEEPPPLSQLLPRLYNNRRLYAVDVEQRRD